MHLFFKSGYKKIHPAVIHTCAWIAYTGYIYITNYLSNPKLRIIDTITFLIPYYITFYVVLYFLNLFKNRGLAWSIASFFIVFVVMSVFGYCFIYWLLPLMGLKLYKTGDFLLFLQAAVLGYVQFFTYAMLYFYFYKTIRKERELRKLEEEKSKLEQQKIQKELENAILKQQELKAKQEKLEFEYAFLRSQINPHFLHNTLNILFSQAMKVSPDLADNIGKLSDMMRYSMESMEYKSGVVSVQKELDNLQTLIEINNMRFAHAHAVDYCVEGEVQGQLVPPLCMITIVENAFKYGDGKDAAHPVQIKVKLRTGQVYFFCRNKKKKNNIELSSHSIGITNLTKRLDAVFKDRYRIETTDEEMFYTFELTINTT